MIDYPKTIEEARAYRYNNWAGNPKGRKYKEGYCAYEIMVGMLFHQCSRKKGYGPDGLYCKQHTKRVEEQKEATDVREISTE